MTLPNTMIGKVTMGRGDLEQMALHPDWPRPLPARSRVLIKVAATYPREQLREAQAAFIAKRRTGNIVVVP